MNSFDEQKYNSARSVGERFFDNNRIIHSACLGAVHINSEGFMHLIFKNNRHKRDWKNQTKRFHLQQDGKIIFWSIIPSWKTKEYKDIKFTILHKGDPDED